MFYRQIDPRVLHQPDWDIGDIGLPLLDALYDPRVLLRAARQQLKAGESRLFYVCIDPTVHTRAEWQAVLKQGGFASQVADAPITLPDGLECLTISLDESAQAEALAAYSLGPEPPRAICLVAPVAPLERLVDQTNQVTRLAERSGMPIEILPAAETPEATLDLLYQLVYLCETLEYVAFMDSGGLGHRLVQAKRAGLLPAELKVLAIAQSNVWLDHWLHGAVPPQALLETVVRERLSVELADGVIFPNGQLQALYTDTFGFCHRESAVIRALPIPATVDETAAPQYQSLKRLIFLGSAMGDRGLDLFSKACAELEAPAFEIELLGRAESDVTRFSADMAVTPVVWNITEDLARFKAAAEDSLVICCEHLLREPSWWAPLMESGCPFLLPDQGALADLLPLASNEQFTYSLNPIGLALAIARFSEQTVAQRQAMMRQFCTQYRQHCEVARGKEQAQFARLLSLSAPAPVAAPGAVSVIVPSYNGSPNRLAQVAAGIMRSELAPHEVLLIDDGSNTAGIQALEQAVPAFGSLPVKLLKHSVNQGLSAARNTGLNAVSTPYVCAHDNDDVIHPQFLSVAQRMLDENPSVGAVTAYLDFFSDTDWPLECAGQTVSRHVGADAGLGLQDNCFGNSLAVFRVSALKSIGGWNASSRAQWEDWECLYRLYDNGWDVWVVPQTMGFYRISANSMLRTYDHFQGWLRVGGVLNQPNKAKALSIMQAVRPPNLQPAKPATPNSRLRRWLRLS